MGILTLTVVNKIKKGKAIFLSNNIEKLYIFSTLFYVLYSRYEKMTPISERKHGNFFSFHYFNSMFLVEDICIVLIMLATFDKYLYLCLSIMFIKITWALYSLYKVNQVLSKPSSSSKTQVAEVGLEWTGEWSFTYLLQTLGLLTVFRVVVGITWNWILPIEFLFQLYDYYFCVEHVHLLLYILGWRFYHLPKAKKHVILYLKRYFPLIEK